MSGRVCFWLERTEEARWLERVNDQAKAHQYGSLSEPPSQLRKGTPILTTLLLSFDRMSISFNGGKDCE